MSKQKPTSSQPDDRRSDRREFLRRAGTLSVSAPAVSLLFSATAIPTAVQAQPPITLTLTVTPPPPPTTGPPQTTLPPMTQAPGGAVPEPATAALIGSALAGWALLRRNVRQVGFGWIKRWWDKA